MLVARELENMPSLSRWGCLPTIGSALLSSLLLFLNGAVVLAIINALSSGHSPLIDLVVKNDKWTQFLVLCGPVVLLILEWLMFDYLRSILRSHQAVAGGDSVQSDG